MKQILTIQNAQRKAIAMVLLLFVATALWAVPAKPGLKRQLTLTNGTVVTAQLVGDEFGHYWVGQDGKAYQAVKGSDVYQLIDAEAVKQKAQVRRTAVNKQRMRRLAPSKVGQVGNYTGSKKGLIILVSFSDVAFTTSNANQFPSIVNNTNYVQGNFKGSMHDYFLAQSENKFDLTFDVVGPVTVSNTQSYYGQNDTSGNDMYPATMVGEALVLANSQVNYADYDWDGDGEVDQVYIVYAGKGEADGGDDDTIWPHQYSLSSASWYGDGPGAKTLDGVKIDKYACGGEKNGSTGALNGIGTMCHEFSHCLGYPDFYDTDYSGGQGMGNWDLMDSGSYNGNGYQPAGYTGWERWAAGWKEPIELLYTRSVTNMQALQNGGEFYIIYNKGNNNEYYMLENRQKVGWDASLPGAGLLILHVDYNASVWSSNKPNDELDHQRMTWIPADNEYQYYTYWGQRYYTEEGMATDPFPYGSVNAFNKNTTPAAKFYNKNSDNTYYLDSSVENITQNSNGTVSFNFKGISTVASPVFSPAPGRFADAQNVIISCETEGSTIYYTSDGSTPSATHGTVYSSPITVSQTTTLKAVAIKDGEESDVVTAKYTIGVVSNPETTTFRRVESVDDLESDMRYIIACESKSKAAGSLQSGSNPYLSSQNVTVEEDGDLITISDNVAVFILVETNNGWAFKNESTGQYLYATAAKKMAYSNSAQDWTLSNNGTVGVGMTFGDYGTMLFNSGQPRFTTYTSNPTTSMIVAHLYMEFTEPQEKQDITMSFDPAEIEMTWGGTFTQPTLIIEPAGLNVPVNYTSSDTDVATVNPETGEVTIVGIGSTTITASFVGNLYYNPSSASYSLVVNEAPIDPNADRYELVTDANTLVSGDKLLFAYINVGNNVKRVMSTNQTTSNRPATNDVILNSDNTLTPGSAAQVITLEKDGDYYLFNVGNGYLYIGNSGNTLRTKATYDDNSKATISISDGDATIQFQGTNQANLLRYNPSAIIFACYKSTTTNMAVPQIYRLKKTAETVTIGKTGYATLYYSQKNLVVPEGVKAVTYAMADGKLEESKAYEAGDVIPQGTAVVLVDQVALEEGVTSHEYSFYKTPDNGEEDDANLLMGFDEDTETVGPDGSTEGYKFYMLSLDKNSTPGSVGFYFAKNHPNGEPFVSKAHKAYLPLPLQAAGSKSFFLFSEMGTTGIYNLQNYNLQFNGSAIYDLQGRRIESSKLPKGIYIVNGKKVVVK